MIINNFRDPKYAFLANDYPCIIHFDGLYYPTVEHAFQAAKTLDLHQRESILKTTTARDAKKIGRSLDLRPGWDDMREDIMLSLLNEKFISADWSLRQKLFSTEDFPLIFENKISDRFWGVCDGVGENRLGKLLMQIRKDLYGVYYGYLLQAQDNFLHDMGWIRQPKGDELWERCYAAPWNQDEWFSISDALKHQERIVSNIVDINNLIEDEDEDEDEEDWDDTDDEIIKSCEPILDEDEDEDEDIEPEVEIDLEDLEEPAEPINSWEDARTRLNNLMKNESENIASEDEDKEKEEVKIHTPNPFWPSY